MRFSHLFALLFPWVFVFLTRLSRSCLARYSVSLSLFLSQTDRRATLSNHTKRTLGSGNLRAAVKVPDGEDRNEWIAVSAGLRTPSPSVSLPR
jgi:hypothetical protein